MTDFLLLYRYVFEKLHSYPKIGMYIVVVIVKVGEWVILTREVCVKCVHCHDVTIMYLLLHMHRSSHCRNPLVLRDLKKSGGKRLEAVH